MSSVSGISSNALAAAMGAGSETTSGKGTTQIASQEVFLQLLVAQLKNQNPMNPMDGMQFVSQLAQFSELEQLLAIRQGVEHLGATTGASQNPGAAVTPATSS